MEPLIVCDNLVKIYKIADQDVVALQGLDMVVQEGELLGIVGVSGSGKTSLMNILGGLDRPTAGRAWVGGKDLLKMSDMELNHYRLTTVGFVWQQASRNLVPYLSALRNVEMPMILAGNVGNKKRKQAEALLDAVGLRDRRYHRLSELSGGEQQRAAIAVGLANNPRLLLADEPTGEVDEATAQTIYNIFRNLNTEYQLTTLIVSHDTNLAHHTDRVIAIRDGKITSETIRADNGWSPDDPLKPVRGEFDAKSFQELTVLDSAGRLQIPKDYLEKFNISSRAQLEMTEDGILVRPVAQSAPTQAAEALVAEMIQARKKVGPFQKLAKRLLARMGGPDES
jgi:ABC-type lipoprotein export system ATPase subunit/bifunctional DNA-binding transcriptional regulator/antitoxin component of YhaV-PrlF toxin-antitoxin module